jgi:hypothetical protein
MGDPGQKRLAGLHPGRWAVSSLLVMLVFGLFATAAIAGSGTSASDQYGGTKVKVIKPAAKVVKPAAKVVKPRVKGVSATKTVSTPVRPVSRGSASGSLPFTGASLLWVLAVGGGLVVVGLVLRRRNERDQS